MEFLKILAIFAWLNVFLLMWAALLMPDIRHNQVMLVGTLIFYLVVALSASSKQNS